MTSTNKPNHDTGYEELSTWLNSDSGERWSNAEQHLFKTCAPHLFGSYGVCIGSDIPSELLASTKVRHWFRLNSQISSSQTIASQTIASEINKGNIYALPTSLPIASESCQIVVLSHVFDVEHNKHLALREAVRVLQPGGTLLIIGFNPFSLWKIAQWSAQLSFTRSRWPWCAQPLRWSRLRDWLTVLDLECEIETSTMMWPWSKPEIFASRGLSQSKNSLNNIVENTFRWGGVYFLVCKKRRMFMRPIKINWRQSVSTLSIVPNLSPQRINFKRGQKPPTPID